MAETGTTTSAAVTAADLVIPVTSATGFATYSSTVPQYMRVNNEYMLISPLYVAGSKNINVFRRGDQGTIVSAHNALSPVSVGLMSDLQPLQSGAVSPVARPTATWGQVTYSVSGAIAIPEKDTTVILDKAGVAVMTLAVPALDQDGLKLYIVGVTAQANTVTLPSASFVDGLTGGPHTIWTATTGFKGQGVLLQASQGTWLVISNNGGTFS